MKRKQNSKIYLLLILVLVISVGYAALTTTIKINGTSSVKGLSWSVYWDNVVPTTGSVTGANVVTAPTTTGTTTTTIDFSVILPEPGDFYEFEVDAVNAGTIDAMIADEGIITKAYSDSNYANEVTLPDVVRYTVTYQDGTEIEDNHLLAKKRGNTETRETYKVRVEYRNDSEIDPDDLDSVNDRVYYLRFQVEYVQADSNAVSPHPKYATIERQVEGQISKGDIVTIAKNGVSERFKVIDSTNEKIVLGTEYCLNSNGEQASGTGAQNLQYSGSAYWYNAGNLREEYAKDIYGNPASFAGNPYPYVYNDNCYLKNRVDNYGTKVGNLGVTVLSARLMTYEEAIGLTAAQRDIGQWYWIGSAIYDDIWTIHNNGSLSFILATNKGQCLRPIIEIGTYEL